MTRLRPEGKCPDTVRPEGKCSDTVRPERKCPATLRPDAWCRGELRPNSHCLCVLRWERYVRCQGASRASRAPGASGRNLCVRTHIFFPDAYGPLASLALLWRMPGGLLVSLRRISDSLPYGSLVSLRRMPSGLLASLRRMSDSLRYGSLVSLRQMPGSLLALLWRMPSGLLVSLQRMSDSLPIWLARIASVDTWQLTCIASADVRQHALWLSRIPCIASVDALRLTRFAWADAWWLARQLAY